MKLLTGGKALVEALRAEGYPLPEHVAEMRLVITPSRAMMLQYDLFISEEDLGRLGRAFVRLAEASPPVPDEPAP